MHEGPGTLFDGGMDFIFHHDGPKRGVAGAQSLGQDDEVGDDPPGFNAEIATAATDAGHHLIDNKFDIICITNLSDALPIAVFRYDGTGRGPHDRLGDEGADRFGAFVFDAAFEFVGTLQVAGFRGFLEAATVAVGGFDVRGVLKKGQVVAPAGGMAA